MKIVITGSANGIGKAIADRFKDHDVVGYDIIDGNDITKNDVMNRLINDCLDADVFINNARPIQILMLSKIYNLWKDQHKTIVNISSACTYIYPTDIIEENFKNYFKIKQDLDQTVKLFQARSPLPHIINVRPSWVDTSASSYYTQHKMKPEDLANMIYDSLNTKGYQILDIVVK
jgi:nucleoside-diphosphate-sugar epimerase